MNYITIINILKDSINVNNLIKLDLLLCDKIGQVPVECLSVIDIILCTLRINNIFICGLLIIFTFDHTQLQPVNGRPLLTSTYIITCFKMIALKASVRASGYQ